MTATDALRIKATDLIRIIFTAASLIYPGASWYVIQQYNQLFIGVPLLIFSSLVLSLPLFVIAYIAILFLFNSLEKQEKKSQEDEQEKEKKENAIAIITSLLVLTSSMLSQLIYKIPFLNFIEHMLKLLCRPIAGSISPETYYWLYMYLFVGLLSVFMFYNKESVQTVLSKVKDEAEIKPEAVTVSIGEEAKIEEEQ